MGEKCSVGEIVETGGIIAAHAFFESGNEVVPWDVMMMALVVGRAWAHRR
jgi:hypothetical protein